MKRWQYETAADLDQSIHDRLRNFPREPDLLVYTLRTIAALVIRFLLRVYHRYEVHGRENLPADSSFVLVCNHTSHLDAPCLISALPLARLHRIFPAAAEDYFFKSLPRVWFTSIVINALPFSRQVHIRESMSLCANLLENRGNILIVFPEGTRSATGEIGRFKPGIGNLLAGRDIPVIPCHLRGAYAAWNRRSWFPKPRKVSLVIGQPRCYAGHTCDRKNSHSIADELREEIVRLSSYHESD